MALTQKVLVAAEERAGSGQAHLAGTELVLFLADRGSRACHTPCGWSRTTSAVFRMVLFLEWSSQNHARMQTCVMQL